MTDQPQFTPGPLTDLIERLDSVRCAAQTTHDYRAIMEALTVLELHNNPIYAAAPDMFAALEGLLGLLDAGSIYERQALAARAALAKARAQA